MTFTLAIRSPSCASPGNQFLNSGFESGEANWAPSPGVIGLIKADVPSPSTTVEVQRPATSTADPLSWPAAG